MDRSIIRGLGFAAVGTGVGVAMARRASRRAETPFYDETRPPGTPEQYGSVRFAMPFHFRHSHSFASLHEASFDAVRESLPSAELRPLRLPDGHALVYVLASRHLDVTDGSDHPTTVLFPSGGEVTVAAVVTRGPESRLRTLSTLVGMASGGAELFGLHMPVTHRQGREAGRLAWGLPKFVADMDFDDDTLVQRVRVAEEDAHILTLTVRPGGRPLILRQTVAQYSVLDGHLIRMDMPSHAYMQRRFGGADIEIGTDHPVAADLRRLGLSQRALISWNIPALRVIAMAGVPVGDATPYNGYAGMDRDFGRFTVRYPGTGPIDQYAGIRAAMEAFGSAAGANAPRKRHAEPAAV